MQSRIRQRSNVTLLRLNQELGEANQVKSRFFAILSHDLHSPIANLISFLNLRRDNPDLLSPDKAVAQYPAYQLHIGFGICVWASFGARSFNLLLTLIRSTKLQVYTSARLTQNCVSG
ncbi:hypothetical protein [Dyadobacter sp. 50-39]|uniref:hypothetical protein n=1 Tax=Dyadobacter sp. 50-39 TaxID=1895756 RepID=UPI0025C16F52|nr:hypothetical protein [Dyadobacter sp. 50-39]